MANVAQIVIEVDEKGAVVSLTNISNAAKKIDPALEQVGRRGNIVMTGLVKDHQKAREASELLASSIGIQIPRSIQKVITESAGMRTALLAAFNVSAAVGIVAFAATQIIDMIDRIHDAIIEIGDGSEQAQQTFQNNGRKIFQESIARIKQLQEQTALATAGSVRQIQIKLAADLKEIDDKINSQRALGQQKAVDKLVEEKQQRINLAGAEEIARAKAVSETIIQLRNAAELEGASARKQLITRTDQEIDKIEREFVDEKISRQEAYLQQQAIADAARIKELQMKKDAAAAGDLAIQQATAAAGAAGRTQIELQYAARIKEIELQELKSGIDMDRERTAAKIEEDGKLLDLARQRATELRDLETETAIAILPPWQRADAQIVADAEKRVQQIRELIEKDKNFEAQGQREITLIWRQETQKRVENLASQLESVYDEITTGGIKQFFLKQFKHMVFEMVAAWIIGMQQMRGASQGTFSGGQGGILGTIFGSGGIFGGGGGNGPGGTPPFVGNFLGLNSGNGDFGGEASGGRGGLAGILGLGGSAGGGLLNQIFSHGAGPISGSILGVGGLALLAASFRKGGILGALGGAAGGALTGFAIAGPIGALIGGIIGLISGIWGHSTKKARLAIEAQIKQKAKDIEDGYNLFQMDWSTSRDQLEQLRTQGVDALRQAGVKDISRSRVGHVDQWIDKAEKEIDATQAERNRRGAQVYGPPQFHRGGIVGPELAYLSPGIPGARLYHSGGEVNANLLVGEGVLTRRGMNAVGGEAGLGRLNAGGGTGGGEMHFHINAIDAKSFREWLNQGGAKEIVKALRWGDLTGHWSFNG